MGENHDDFYNELYETIDRDSQEKIQALRRRAREMAEALEQERQDRDMEVGAHKAIIETLTEEVGELKESLNHFQKRSEEMKDREWLVELRESDMLFLETELLMDFTEYPLPSREIVRRILRAFHTANQSSSTPSAFPRFGETT